jgi:UDP-N-acetylmuramoylalanine--D-glutamate ligase
LIAGGRDKNLDYRAILDLAVKKAKEIILIGEAKDKIRAALKGHPAIAEASSLEEAVNVAFRRARPGDCVLLSPMCASFDMFADFEDRGRVFKQIVRNIAKRES